MNWREQQAERERERETINSERDSVVTFQIENLTEVKKREGR